ALRYGALPLVRRTGGLADTVVDANAVTLAEGSATGFVFADETRDALLEAARRGGGRYAGKAGWGRLSQAGVGAGFRWAAAARQYAALYAGLLTRDVAPRQRRLA